MTADASVFAAVNEKKTKSRFFQERQSLLFVEIVIVACKSKMTADSLLRLATKKCLWFASRMRLAMLPPRLPLSFLSDVFYDALNLKKQYTICSGGLLNFEPVDYFSKECSWSGGRHYICEPLWSNREILAETQASTALSNKGVSSSVYDYVMFVCPQVVYVWRCCSARPNQALGLPITTCMLPMSWCKCMRSGIIWASITLVRCLLLSSTKLHDML